jgi:predicted RNA methylase
MTQTQRAIDQSVLTVLSAGTCDGQHFFLPPTQLDRGLYTKTNQVLEALGGRWHRQSKAHVFAAPCVDLIESAIETGSYARPADLGWFPTPAPIAQRVAFEAGIAPGHRVLEPSAGLGPLVRAAQLAGGVVDAIEMNQERAESLRKIVDHVRCADFLQVRPEPIYDRVVMNPPFAKRADIHHVQHARKFLKPGGILVSIVSAGVFFREDRLTREFRNDCIRIEPLPDGSFTESGTEVRTAIVKLTAAKDT